MPEEAQWYSQVVGEGGGDVGGKEMAGGWLGHAKPRECPWSLADLNATMRSYAAIVVDRFSNEKDVPYTSISSSLRLGLSGALSSFQSAR